MVGWHDEKLGICRKKTEIHLLMGEKVGVSEEVRFQSPVHTCHIPFAVMQIILGLLALFVAVACVVLCVTTGNSILFSAGQGKLSRAWNIK